MMDHPSVERCRGTRDIRCWTHYRDSVVDPVVHLVDRWKAALRSSRGSDLFDATQSAYEIDEGPLTTGPAKASPAAYEAHPPMPGLHGLSADETFSRDFISCIEHSCVVTVRG